MAKYDFSPHGCPCGLMREDQCDCGALGKMKKRLIYQVYLGKKSKLYDWCTASVKAYADRIGADYLCRTQPNLMIRPNPFRTGRSKEAVDRLGYLPIFEKENAFAHWPDYDQIAIIDSDIYVRPNAPDLFNEIPSDADFAGVLERSLPITPAHRQKLAGYSRMQYGPLKNEIEMQYDRHGAADFYNMGMMLMNKSLEKYLWGQNPLEFLKRPEFQDFVDGIGPWKWSTDQTLLNYWIKKEKMKVTDLHWKWNALYTAIPNEDLKKAYFVHFYLKDKLPQQGENVEELRKLIE